MNHLRLGRAVRRPRLESEIMDQSLGQRIFLTGATGFIGSEILKALLERGRRVTALVRARDHAAAFERIASMLGPQRTARLGRDQLQFVVSDLNQERFGLDDAAWSALCETTCSIIHAAGSVRFDADHRGEPFRTNLDGLRVIAALAAESRAPLHHFSTAFVCGAHQGTWNERDQHPSTPQNAYEASKWAGEEFCRGLLEQGTLSALTIFRPGIAVADTAETAGRGTHGLVAFVRCLQRVAKLLRRMQGSGALDLTWIPIPTRPEAPVHAVPIGWLVAAFMHIFERPLLHHGVYHLTLAHPPSVRDLFDAIQRTQGLKLACAEDDGVESDDPMRRDFIDVFKRASRTLRPYFRQRMRFGVDRLHDALAGSGLEGQSFPATCWPDALAQSAPAEPLLEPAFSTPAAPAQIDVDCHAYFTRWLFAHANRSSVAQMRSLSLSAGFAIAGGGDWTCRWAAGQLVHCMPGLDPQAVQFHYSIELDAFMETVAGCLTPQEAFFTGRAEIHGDVEGGLKFSMILRQFIVEFPWSPALKLELSA